jgi:hypothetical protein
VQVQTGPDLADMGKFAGFLGPAATTPGFRLVVDDDIIYPAGYVAGLLQAVEAYHRQAIVGYHGVVLNHWPVQASYYRERTVWHANQALEADRPVHIVATNTAAWHTSALDLRTPPDLSSGHYMADLWLGRLAQQQGVPLVCLAHPAQWLEMLVHPTSIYDTYRQHDPQQAAYVNAAPWVLPALPARVIGE